MLETCKYCTKNKPAADFYLYQSETVYGYSFYAGYGIYYSITKNGKSRVAQAWKELILCSKFDGFNHFSLLELGYALS